jgi:hypothetical protein
MTLAHFSVSSTMSLPKAADEPAITVPPSSATPPISKNAPRAAPGAVDAGVGTHRGNPTPWTSAHDLITPKLTPDNL